MFKIGDEVRVRSSGAKGVVGYVEDGYISVGLDNGAEMDFTDEASLQHEADFIAYVQAERDAAVAVEAKKPRLENLPYIPRKGDRRVAATAMEMVKKIYPMVLDAARTNHEGFDDLDAFDQVKVLSEVTGTPMIVFMGAAEMNDESMMREVLRRTVINNIVGDSMLVRDMLIGHTKRIIAKYEDTKE
jgi:hypothetical protein